MSTENTRHDVAVFIDFENVYVSVREKLDSSPDFESMMDYCNDLGRVVIARAYADWYRYPRITSALYANGIEPMYVPTYYYDKDMGRTGHAIKNSVDMNLCIEAMKTLFLNDNIAKFVLVTGDRDFIPLVNSIRQQGKEVIIIGIGGAASTHLGQSADEFVFYEQLVGKTPGPSSSSSSSRSRTRSKRSVNAKGTVSSSKQEPASEPDIYDTLVEAVHLVRERGYLSTLGSLKLVMKELMGGDFKESHYKDANGRNFTKFKDFVVDAERRGKVQIYTNGTVSEVFLPGEDAKKLSQFADIKEESPETATNAPVGTNGKQQQSQATLSSSPSSSSGRSRRRRRPQRNQRQETAQKQPAPDVVSSEHETKQSDDTSSHTSDVLSAALSGEQESLSEEPSYDAFAEHFATYEKLDAEQSEAINQEQLKLPENEHSLFNVGEAMTLSQMVETLDDLASELHSPDETSLSLVDITTIDSDDGTHKASSSESEPGGKTSPASTDLTDETPSSTSSDEPSSAQSQDDSDDKDDIRFTEEEWQAFCRMMADFSKPASFAQIFDGLRGLRQQQVIVRRTNEQLRNMVKQAINSGLLDRSGRGKRVYYTLKETGEEEPVTIE